MNNNPIFKKARYLAIVCFFLGLTFSILCGMSIYLDGHNKTLFSIKYNLELGQVKEIEYAIKHMYFIDDKIDEEGNTALHLAIISGQKKMITFLLQNGARRDIKNNHGKTSDDYAEEKGINLSELSKESIEAQ